MLYIGHFSFDKKTSEDELRHGFFDCVAMSDDPKRVVEQFSAQIRELKKTSSLFDGIVSIYLDDIIEIKHISEKAVITRFQSSQGEHPRYSNCSLPSDGTDGLTAYQYVPDGQEYSPVDEDGYKELQPFVEFGNENV